MALITLTLSLIVLFSGLVYFYIKQQFSYWRKRGIPHVPPKLPYGNFSGMGRTKHTSQIIDEIYRKFKGQAPFAGAYFTISPTVIAMDLDLIKDITIKNFDYFSDRPLYSNIKDDYLTEQLLRLDGEAWKKCRSLLSPTFTSGKMKFMFSTVVDVSDKFVEALEKARKVTDQIEIKDLLARFSTDVIGSCAFGVECNSLQNPTAEFRAYGKKVFSEPRHSTFPLFLFGQFPNVARAFGIKVYKDEVCDFFTKAITETINFREKNNVHRNDFLDMLIPLKADPNEKDNKGKMTMKQIIGHAFLFFLAGFESTSSTITYALYELALNTDIQNKARSEVQGILKQFNGEMCYEAIMGMRYLDQIISETLRKYSTVPRLVRYANKDYKVPYSNLIIEKGTTVFIPVFSIHRDPEYYPNPEVFDPSRFDPAEAQKRHPIAFLGFGEGPRHCVGLRFARMQACILLANLLRNFIIKPCDKTPKRLQHNLKTEVLAPTDSVYLEINKL